MISEIDPSEVVHATENDLIDSAGSYVTDDNQLVIEFWLKDKRHWRLFVEGIQEVNE